MSIEQKALELVNAVRTERAMFPYPINYIQRASYADYEALCRAIEAHEAFRKEVSEFALGVKEYMRCCGAMGWQNECDAFILPQADPLERLKEWATKHSDVTPLDGTDSNSPTFGELRQALSAIVAKGGE